MADSGTVLHGIINGLCVLHVVEIYEELQPLILVQILVSLFVGQGEALGKSSNAAYQIVDGVDCFF